MYVSIAKLLFGPCPLIPTQIPAPPSNTSLRACACVTLLPGGTLRVSQTLPPMVDPRPIVTRPRIVAPA